MVRRLSADNFEYLLEGSPCAAIKDLNLISEKDDIQNLFPSFGLLKDLNIKEYLGAPMIDSKGEAIGILACLHNEDIEDLDIAKHLLGVFSSHAASILEREMVVEEKEAVRYQLLQSQKMESIGQPAGGIAHDFNNLLVIIEGYVDLVINSRDAMAQGGSLSISTKNVTINQQLVEKNIWAQEGEFVRIRIVDTGRGIPVEIQDRVFEPFFTTKLEGEGTGLGLSVLFGVVKQLNGFLKLQSDEGKGTTFDIFFPLIKDQAGQVSESAEPKVLGGKETLLLVEDEAQIRELCELILSHAGYSVILAEDGEVAISLFEKHCHELSLVVLDVVLPIMGGHEVMKKIQKIKEEVPILFMSDYAPEGIHTNFILEDGLTLLQKPFQSRDLLSKVREKIDEKSTYL